MFSVPLVKVQFEESSGVVSRYDDNGHEAHQMAHRADGVLYKTEEIIGQQEQRGKTREKRRLLSFPTDLPFLVCLELPPPPYISKAFNMEEAAKTAKESLDLAFRISNILGTGLDRHTLSVLIALCDMGLNPEALAAVVKELQTEPCPLPPTPTVSS
ncbi:hypothetical protein V6N11_017696 [Hibiscus sabdariffa]|uniref:Uncharacterized protein n=1 Tax=Hibiscus sabdariffa TaxID=183260 RepID=A0ABR2TYZ9_9ROSI